MLRPRTQPWPHLGSLVREIQASLVPDVGDALPSCHGKPARGREGSATACHCRSLGGRQGGGRVLQSSAHGGEASTSETHSIQTSNSPGSRRCWWPSCPHRPLLDLPTRRPGCPPDPQNWPCCFPCSGTPRGSGSGFPTWSPAPIRLGCLLRAITPPPTVLAQRGVGGGGGQWGDLCLLLGCLPGGPPSTRPAPLPDSEGPGPRGQRARWACGPFRATTPAAIPWRGRGGGRMGGLPIYTPTRLAAHLMSVGRGRGLGAPESFFQIVCLFEQKQLLSPPPPPTPSPHSAPASTLHRALPGPRGSLGLGFAEGGSSAPRPTAA